MRPVPTTFRAVARFWHLTPAQAQQFWTALTKSTDPKVVAWRFHLCQHVGRGRGSSEHLIDVVSAPTTVLPLIEQLIADGLLDVRTGHQLEECLLRRTTRRGTWVG
jgi:hypothetical protein